MRKSTLVLLIFALLLNGCVQQPAEKHAPTSSPTLTPTPITVSASPLPAHGFVVGNEPFQFLGANVNENWHKWSKAADDDLVESAKASGFTVLCVYLPCFESQLGDYREVELVKLDHLLDVAYRNGVYVILPFIHAYGISIDPTDPYYNPGGVEGLVKDQRLGDAFKKRMAVLISRTNTVNGRKYSEDPTILAWMLCQELRSGDQNYTPGQVTVSELSDWIEEMASYVKRLDPNHLVTLNTHSTIAKTFDNWFEMLEVPSLDFVDVEDAEARFLHITNEPVDFYLKVFTLNKPVTIMISFSGGTIDQMGISQDYSWQSETLRKIFSTYYEMGVATGFTIYQWASELSMEGGKEQPYRYTASNKVMVQAFLDIASTLGSRNSTTIPLQFVRVSYK